MKARSCWEMRAAGKVVGSRRGAAIWALEGWEDSTLREEMARSASIEASKPTPNAVLFGAETDDGAGLGSEVGGKDGVKDGANNGAKEGSVAREVIEPASVPLDWTGQEINSNWSLPYSSLITSIPLCRASFKLSCAKAPKTQDLFWKVLGHWYFNTHLGKPFFRLISIKPLNRRSASSWRSETPGLSIKSSSSWDWKERRKGNTCSRPPKEKWRQKDDDQTLARNTHQEHQQT